MSGSASGAPAGISTASYSFIKLSVHLHIELNCIIFLTYTPLDTFTNLTTESEMTGGPLFLLISSEKKKTTKQDFNTFSLC